MSEARGGRLTTALATSLNGMLAQSNQAFPQTLAFFLKPPPGNHSGTYLTESIINY
jgi:hypothetical protein